MQVTRGMRSDNCTASDDDDDDEGDDDMDNDDTSLSPPASACSGIITVTSDAVLLPEYARYTSSSDITACSKAPPLLTSLNSIDDAVQRLESRSVVPLID